MINRIFYKTFFILLFFSNIAYSQEEDPQIYAKDVFIKLEVRLCKRNCPYYNITINGDGTVEYEGKRNVSKLGKFTKHISKTDVAKLISKFFNFKFFTRKDESTNCFTRIKFIENSTYEKQDNCYVSSHGSFISIEVKYGNQQHKVNLEYLFSEDYRVLKQSIINTTGVKEWIREN